MLHVAVIGNTYSVRPCQYELTTVFNTAIILRIYCHCQYFLCEPKVSISNSHCNTQYLIIVSLEELNCLLCGAYRLLTGYWQYLPSTMYLWFCGRHRSHAATVLSSQNHRYIPCGESILWLIISSLVPSLPTFLA